MLRNDYVMMTQSNLSLKKVMIHNNLSKTLQFCCMTSVHFVVQLSAQNVHDKQYKYA